MSRIEALRTEHPAVQRVEALDLRLQALASSQAQFQAGLKDLSEEFSMEIANHRSAGLMAPQEQGDFRNERAEVMRAIQAEHEGRVQEITDLRTEIVQKLELEVTKAVRVERDGRTNDLRSLREELLRAIDLERDGRVQQINSTHADLAKAIARERDDRICENADQRQEICKAMREWHNRLRVEGLTVFDDNDVQRSRDETTSVMKQLFGGGPPSSEIH